MSGIGTAINDVGGAVTDLFGASGSAAASTAYATAAQIAQANAALTLRSGQIQEEQENIAITKSLGTETSDTAGAGFKNSGSALSLLKSSTQQGALAKQLIQNQTEITAQGYDQQAAAYEGQAKAASTQASGQTAGGLLNIVGAATNIPGVTSAVSSVVGAASATGDAAAVASTALDAAEVTGDVAGAADATTAVAAAASSTDFIATALAAIASIVSWVICTELMKQHRLPKRWWVHGSKVFANYPKAVQEGYYVWAVPSVRHLRRHPHSLYSRCLCRIFNWRAENIAAHAGVPGARRLLRGALVTAVLWPVCYALGWARLKLNKTTDWKGLYNA